MGGDQAAMTAATQNPAAPIASQTSPDNQALGKWYAIAGVASILSDLVGGFSQMSAGRDQQALYEEQAQLIEEEGARDNAQLAREAEHFQARQAHQYLNSGVILQGSPLLILDETRKLATEELNARDKQTKARAKMARMQGAASRKSGRNSMFGNLLGALGTGATTYLTAKRLGLFGNQGYNTPGGFPATPDNPGGWAVPPTGGQ